ICLFFILWGIKCNAKGLSLKDILKSTLSPVGSVILFSILAVFFLIRSINLLVSTYEVFSTTFAVKSNWLGFAIPVCALCFFVISRGFNSIVRMSSFLATFILLALALIMAFASPSATYSNIKPYLEFGLTPVVKGAFNSTFWFSDYLFILLIMEDIKDRRKIFVSIPVCFIFGATMTVLMQLLFIGLFGELSPYSYIAISKVSQFTAYISDNGRLDWLSLSIWFFAIFLKLFTMLFCCYKCFIEIFVKNKQKINYFWLSIIFLPILAIPLIAPMDTVMYGWFGIGAGKYVFWVVQYALPLSIPLLTKLANKNIKGLNVEVTHYENSN
ncbi:MAG: GerAB/ArcD/ProY family transporter, partial [Clostridia bacterium]